MVTKGFGTFLRNWILQLVLILLPNLYLFAQTTANFTADALSGCAPVLINFTNTSSNANSYSWDLGNGKTSNNVHTSALYAQPGIYTVTLTANGVGGSNAKTTTITVYGAPIAELSANKTDLCGNEALKFTDLSIPQSAAVSGWFWSFGDGQISNAQNPTHLYNQDGKYTVYLQVTDANGCKASTTKTNYININQPKANFIADSFVCTLPADIHFTDKSSGLNLSYSWEFGGGATSNAKSPVHTYFAFDTIPVKLTVTSGGSNCSSSITKNIMIAKYIASFDFTASCNSSNKFSLNLNNTTIPATKSEWDFGDGDTSTSKNPSHLYSKGSYNITLKSIYSNTCFDTVVKTYVSPNASFSYSALPCKAPFKVNFTNNSIGTKITYDWKFSSGTNSTVKNPSNTFTAPPQYARTILTVTNTWGCKDADTVDFPFPFPVAVVVPDTPFTGCAPLNVGFKSTSYSPNANIVSYKWNFGDQASGSNNTSTLKNPSHIYNQSGIYDVQLIVQNDSGCVDTTIYKKLVKTGVLPTSTNFTMDADSSCFYGAHNFADISTYANGVKANYWCWDWYGGNNNILPNQNKRPVACPDSGYNVATANYTSVKNQNKIFSKKIDYTTFLNGGTLYAYDTRPDTGLHYIHMIVGNNGCYAEVKKPFYIKHNMAAPSFAFPNGEFSLASCTPPFEVGLFDGSFGNTKTNHFNVVNNQSSDTLAKIKGDDTTFVHFTKPGTYSISISASNSQELCTNSNVKTVTVDSIIQKVYIPKKGCKGSPVRIINISSPVYGQLSKREFDFGNGETLAGGAVDTVDYIYQDTGTFVIRSYTYSLIPSAVNEIISYTQCSTVHLDTIYIDGVSANFGVDKNSACGADIINFSDSSYSTKPYTLRRWRFGDNTTSSQINPQHQYFKVGNYGVSLFLKNNAGCTDSIYKANFVSISKPYASFSESKTLACYGDTIKFSNLSTGLGFKYRWDFGQGDTSNLTNPRCIYNQNGLFDVMLVTTNTFGCKDTLLKSNLIDVENYPTVKFSAIDSVGDCSPFLATFSDSSITDVTQWKWDFQEGSVSYAKNPINNYTHPGKYNVKLTATTKNGCSSSLTKTNYIVVNGPYGSYSIQGDSGCVPFTSTFVQNFNETDFYTWNFGDGNIQSYSYIANPGNITHQYNSKGFYSPQIQLLDSNNCSAVLSTQNVFAEKVIANFDLSDTLLCKLGNVQFTNKSTSQFATSYQWDFGDLNYSIQKDPLHAYAAQDTFDVKLISTSVIKGCTSNTSKQVAVFRSPQLTLDTLSKTFCIPYSAIFKVKNNDPQVKINKWLWTHNNEQIDSTYAKFNINTTGDQYFHMYIDYANNLCHIDSLIVLKSMLPPLAKFTFAPEHPTVNSTVDFTENCDNTSIWLWKISDNSTSSQPNPSHDFFKNGEYTVTLYASNEGNCVDSTKKVVRVSPEDFVKVVSGFTPNGDGNNDYVKILNAGDVTLIEFTIYNRWGQQVFKTDNIQHYWDGTFNGTLQNEGTFVYYITATNNKTGKEINQKGNITLLK